MHQKELDYDFIVIGSGFGGAVSAMRLSEKGYKVLVIEQGKWFRENDFPKTNWNLKRWFWLPLFKFFGFFRLSFFRHLTILSGVGVGGGSLVYAGTLLAPSHDFFKAKSWGHLADWKTELKVHYQTAVKMLGVTTNPQLEVGDMALQKLAAEIGQTEHFVPTDVGIYFGESDTTHPDPYFGGKGPKRSGCNFCGGCMIGCRYNAKNTLDKNYLHFAQKFGARIQPESEVYYLSPLDNKNGTNGYEVKWQSSTKYFKQKGKYTCDGVILAGGVLGSIKLLLKLKQSSLPNLSEMLGKCLRTNSESLMGIFTFDKEINFSEGIAISSILRTDKYSHLETVRYPSGSGFWRLLMSPMVQGKSVVIRILKLCADYFLHPLKNFKTYFVLNWAKRTQILMLMQTIDSTLRFTKGVFGIKSSVEKGPSPTTFIPEAKLLADRYAKIVNGKTGVLISETLLGRPTTAHIFGGAVMGENAKEGVIDKDNRVFGYNNMYICDSSMISANPGVNPSLTITAISERAMSKIPAKKQ